MSRCYPFPPPGYENKTRIEDICLLKKEKDREKKHKKEKRDKEKKKGKEKRDGDRSDNKQKEKKQKSRDKRKDEKKIRNKDKNNHVISDEKKFSGQIEAEKREKNFEKREEREKEKITVLGEKVVRNFTVNNGVVLGKNNHLVSEKNNIKQFHELGNKVGTEKGNKGNLFAEKYSSTEITKDLVIMPRIGVTTPVTPMATSERSKERKVNDRRIENKKGEKKKDEDMDNSIDKYKEKVKKIKDTGGELLVGQSKLKDFVVAQSVKPKNPVNGKSRAAAGATAPEIPRKRKELSCNGVLSDIGPNKVPRIMSSSLQNSTEADAGPYSMTKNGRSLQPSQDSGITTPVKQQVLSKVKQNSKGHRINGTTNNSPQSSSRSYRAAKKLLPHPDTKYLTQVLSVPAMEEWSGFDEQEWLFRSSSSHSQVNKPARVDDDDDDDDDDTVQQIWAEAVRIESADVYALPYVIPR